MIPCSKLIDPVFSGTYSACNQVNAGIDMVRNQSLVMNAITGIFGCLTLLSANETIKNAATAVSHLRCGEFSKSLTSGLATIKEGIATYGIGLSMLGAAQSTSVDEFGENINKRQSNILIGSMIAVDTATRAVFSLYNRKFEDSVAFSSFFMVSAYLVFQNLAPPRTS